MGPTFCPWEEHIAHSTTPNARPGVMRPGRAASQKRALRTLLACPARDRRREGRAGRFDKAAADGPPLGGHSGRGKAASQERALRTLLQTCSVARRQNTNRQSVARGRSPRRSRQSWESLADFNARPPQDVAGAEHCGACCTRKQPVRSGHCELYCAAVVWLAAWTATRNTASFGIAGGG